MTALIVDDNAENAYLLESILRATGYETITARNGAEALGQAHKQKPDLIITDILMPVMDGYTFCRECKRDEALKDIPFIVYTATYTDPKDGEFARRLGADKFILKPQEPEVFIDLIRDILDDNARRNIATVQPNELSEAVVLKEYNQALIRKLEDKMRQTEENERRLKAYVIKLEESLRERKRVEEQLRSALGEKEVLLKEVHHRVKNNMQVISSMLKLQLEGTTDPAIRTTLRDSIARIRAMASIHESLYRSQNYAEVNIGGYLRALLRNQVHLVEGRKTSWNVHVEDIHLGLDKSIPCGLLFNEIISYVLHEAMHREGDCTITVELKKSDTGKTQLTVSNETGDRTESTPVVPDAKLSLTLIELLVDQVEGTLRVDHAKGIAVVVLFPS